MLRPERGAGGMTIVKRSRHSHLSAPSLLLSKEQAQPPEKEQAQYLALDSES